MSPDPSVFKEQLDEIRRRRRRPQYRSGCLVVLATLLFCAGIMVGVLVSRRQENNAAQESPKTAKPSEAIEKAVEEEAQSTLKSSGEILAQLRKEAAQIQQRIDDLATSEGLRQRVEDLRAEIAERRTQASADLRKRWDELATRSRELAESAREAPAWKKSSNAVQKMQEIIDMLKRMEQEAPDRSRNAAPKDDPYGESPRQKHGEPPSKKPAPADTPK